MMKVQVDAALSWNIRFIEACPSVEGQPPACFDLVDCCDLDLDL